MRVRRYFLALVVNSLELLSGPRLKVVPARAEPPPPAKPEPRVKPAPRRAIRLDLKLTLRPPAPSRIAVAVAAPAVAAPAVVLTPPPKATARPVPPPRNPYLERRPYLDLEGLLLGDMHIQPNIMFETDGRYNNSSTRERAQRDEIDWLAMRQHGESRGEDPISSMLRTREPVIPGNNDPGFGVATDVRAQLQSLPHPAVPSPVRVAVKRPPAVVPRLAKK